MLEKFENEAFFLWLGLSTSLIRHENGASFSKPLVKPNQSENAGFFFPVDTHKKKLPEKKPFGDDGVTISDFICFLGPSFSNDR